MNLQPGDDQFSSPLRLKTHGNNQSSSVGEETFGASKAQNEQVISAFV